jgi:hypothetical protein
MMMPVYDDMMIMMMMILIMIMMMMNDDNDYDISIQHSGGPIHRAVTDQHISIAQRNDDIETE